MMMFCLGIILLIIAVVSSTHVRMEGIHRRDTFTREIRAKSDRIHELVFAVKQLNLDLLEATTLARSTPGNSLYQQWLTFDEVGLMIQNDEGFTAVKSWLESNNIPLSWHSPRLEFIKASATLAVWENLLQTQFFVWDDSTVLNAEHKKVILAEEYSLPEHLAPHLSAVFNTCQAPPVISKHAQLGVVPGRAFKTDVVLEDPTSFLRGETNQLKLKLAGDKALQGSSVTTVSSVNAFYQIPTNLGEFHT